MGEGWRFQTQQSERHEKMAIEEERKWANIYRQRKQQVQITAMKQKPCPGNLKASMTGEELAMLRMLAEEVGEVAKGQII